MEERDVRKLSRSDLLEMLVEISKENDRLKEELAEANRELENRKIQISQAGSIAEAALGLNGVFDAAQKAADEYVKNIKLLEKAKIKEMIKKDITVLYVSHSKDIQEICERCIYLQKGKVIYDGTMQETLEKYPEFAK